MVPQMIDTKLMTRETYTLYGIEGDFGNKDGKLTFEEKVRRAARDESFVCFTNNIINNSLTMLLLLNVLQ